MRITNNINATIVPEKLETENAWKVDIPPSIFRHANLPGAVPFKFFQA
jgi:hypothetical protein